MDFRDQYRAVIDRYIEKLLTGPRTEMPRIATTSVDVNADLAVAHAGKYKKMAK
jgi:hypothetical protein